MFERRKENLVLVSKTLVETEHNSMDRKSRILLTSSFGFNQYPYDFLFKDRDIKVGDYAFLYKNIVKDFKNISFFF